jgi:hypothetical protein
MELSPDAKNKSVLENTATHRPTLSSSSLSTKPSPLQIAAEASLTAQNATKADAPTLTTTFVEPNCCVCHQSLPFTVIICDGCEKEYHLCCATPPLLSVPEGEWKGVCCTGKDTKAHDFEWLPGMGAYGQSMRSKSARHFYQCNIKGVDKTRTKNGSFYNIHFRGLPASKDEWVDASHLMTHAKKAELDAVERQKMEEKLAAKRAKKERIKEEKQAIRDKQRAEKQLTCSHDRQGSRAAEDS